IARGLAGGAAVVVGAVEGAEAARGAAPGIVAGGTQRLPDAGGTDGHRLGRPPRLLLDDRMAHAGELTPGVVRDRERLGIDDVRQPLMVDAGRIDGRLD